MANQPSKAWNIGLWIAQVILAGIFLMAGFSKISQPIEELTKMLPWVSESNLGLARFVGFAEILGGVGLLLPSILRIKPQLTILAAAGLALVQLFAMIFHISRGETGMIGVNLFFLVLAGLIAWGRTSKAPILPKAAQIVP